MIKLLNELDFIPPKDFNVKELNLKKSIFEIIKEKLVIASEKHELIYTCELRGIGKTYSLIKFAKLHNYSVIVNSIGMAEQLRNHYKFPYIYSQQQVFNKELSDENILVDEGVDFKRINDEGHYNIITGFSHIYFGEHCDRQKSKSIQEQVIENLEEEIKSLSKVIVKARENREHSMYKNLIISLKEVLELYNSEVDQNKNVINPVVNLHIDYSNVANSEDIIETFKKLTPTLTKDKNGKYQFDYLK